jgi:hypothetical protein
MTKLKDGIETGEFQTSGVNDSVNGGESKPRGGEGNAKASAFAHPVTEFAHKQPVTAG